MPLPFAVGGIWLAVKSFTGPIIGGFARIAGRALANPDVLLAGLAAGYLIHVVTTWNDVSDALRKAAAESRAAADAIDLDILKKQLATAQADRDKLIRLRDEDEAEHARYVEELKASLTPDQRACRLPTPADARRLRLR